MSPSSRAAPGWPDPVEPHQSAAGLGDQGCQLLVRGLDPSVDDLELVDQLGRQLPAGLTPLRRQPLRQMPAHTLAVSSVVGIGTGD